MTATQFMIIHMPSETCVHDTENRTSQFTFSCQTKLAFYFRGPIWCHARNLDFRRGKVDNLLSNAGRKDTPTSSSSVNRIKRQLIVATLDHLQLSYIQWNAAVGYSSQTSCSVEAKATVCYCLINAAECATLL